MTILSYNHQINETREPVIYPHDFAALKEDMILITPEGYCRVDKAPYFRKLKTLEE